MKTLKQFLVKYHWFFVALLFVQLAFICAGCAALTWLTDALNILPIAAQGVSVILTAIAALSGGTILPVDVAAAVSAIIAKVVGGIKDIEAIVEEYKANPSTTLLGDIEEALQAVIDNINNFLSDTGIANAALQSVIKNALQWALNELESFQSLLPALTAEPGLRMTIVVPMTTKQAKAAFNTILNTPTGEPEVDAVLAKLTRL